MPKSKKNKRSKQHRPTFYEAVPTIVTPPAPMPDLREHFFETRLALAELWQRLETHIRSIDWKPTATAGLKWSVGQLKLAGLATTNGLLHAAQTARYALGYGASATHDYAPSVAADLRAYARQGSRTVSSRRARAVYLAVIATGALAATVMGTMVAISTITSYTNDISSPAAVLAKKKTGVTILDRNGQVLFEGYGGQANQVVPLKDVPQTLKDATLAAEDPDFYKHPGFSWRGTARAAWVDITHHGRVEGGSTLTQQLVKRALLTSDKNFQRKYQELLLSMQLERRYSKDQILEMYLNEVDYGQGSSGIAAAAQTYFHKPAAELTLSESALLAGMPLGPSRFDPNADTAAATGRRDYVLNRMLALGKITKPEAEAARSQPIQLAATGAPQTTTPESNPMRVYAKQINIQAPHFVFYVLSQLRALYGDDVVEQGGITVRTTLDLSKQHLGEQTVADHVNALSSHHVTNGGLVSIEPGSGDILAMVGSVDYNAPGFGNVNVTLSDLQPGSSFKPIAYATAFKKGWNGASTVDDEPVSFPSGDGTVYAPQNYDLQFHGKVTLRHALDNSLNIPAVKVLQFAGIPETLQTAHDLGVTGLNDPSRYGLSLVLGGGEVRPIDMATVYATFANNGTKVEPRSILKVTDKHGKDITKPSQPKPQAVLDPRIAYMITNILSDDSSRQPEFPANGPLHLSRPAAAKTGTTNDFRDNWTVGYTPQIATAVWVGNNDHTAMENVDGITGAAPIWHDYMEGALSDLPTANFAVPAGITTAKICADGGLANPWDAGINEVFPSDAVPTKHCGSTPTLTRFWNFGNNPNSPIPNPVAEGKPEDNQRKDPEFAPQPLP